MKRLLAVALLVLIVSASASAADLPGFKSPSGNVGSLFIPRNGGAPATILCKLAHADYARSLQARCRQTWRTW
jgi:hypothetical protein